MEPITLVVVVALFPIHSSEALAAAALVVVAEADWLAHPHLTFCLRLAQPTLAAVAAAADSILSPIKVSLADLEL